MKINLNAELIILKEAAVLQFFDCGKLSEATLSGFLAKHSMYKLLGFVLLTGRLIKNRYGERGFNEPVCGGVVVVQINGQRFWLAIYSCCGRSQVPANSSTVEHPTTTHLAGLDERFGVAYFERVAHLVSVPF